MIYTTWIVHNFQYVGLRMDQSTLVLFLVAIFIVEDLGLTTKNFVSKFRNIKTTLYLYRRAMGELPKLSISVHSGKGLCNRKSRIPGAVSDPYVVVCLDGNAKAILGKTDTAKNTLDPVWGSSFNVDVGKVVKKVDAGAPGVVSFIVCDAGAGFGSKKEMGRAQIEYSKISGKKTKFDDSIKVNTGGELYVTVVRAGKTKSATADRDGDGAVDKKKEKDEKKAKKKQMLAAAAAGAAAVGLVGVTAHEVKKQKEKQKKKQKKRADGTIKIVHVNDDGEYEDDSGGSDASYHSYDSDGSYELQEGEFYADGNDSSSSSSSSGSSNSDGEEDEYDEGFGIDEGDFDGAEEFDEGEEFDVGEDFGEGGEVFEGEELGDGEEIAEEEDFPGDNSSSSSSSSDEE